MIETQRLTLLPLTLDQLRLHVADNEQLEASLGLQKGRREITEPLLSIIVHFTVPRLKDSAFDPLYHTIWIAIDRQKEQIVADAKFKGEPDETGTVEIGYGTYPAFQRQGYMSEIVGGLVRWAGQQPGVRRVVADTNAENVASQKVLEKNGFRLFDRLEEMLWWEYRFGEDLQFNELGYLIPSGPVVTTNKTAFDYFGDTNDHRVELWEQYNQLKETAVVEGVPIFYVWIDGSFVTQEPYPNDIDIVIFIPEEYKAQHFRKLALLNQSFPGLDVFWIGLWEEVSPLASAINQMELFKWHEQFGSDRNDAPKGFLEIH